MGKGTVVPTSTSSSIEFQTRKTGLSKSISRSSASFGVVRKSTYFHSDDEAYSEKAERRERNPVIACLLSVRLFIIVIITLLIALCIFSIWITSYVTSQHTALQNTQTLFKTMNVQVSNYLSSQIVPARSVAQTIADDYHNSVVGLNLNVMPYLSSKMKWFGVTGANLCLGEEGLSVLYAYSLSVSAQGTDILLGAFQPNANSRFLMFISNMDTGELYYDQMVRNISYVVSATDYYIDSVKMLKTNSEGGFGPVYKVINSGQAMYWSTPVYDKSLLPHQKKRLGIVKVNVSLFKISQYLLSMSLLSKGFFVVTENDSNYVIGANFVISGLDNDRIPVTNVTEKDTNIIFQKLLNVNPQDADIIKIHAKGVDYLVSTFSYSLFNLKWRITMILHEGEVQQGSIISSYIILGVALFLSLFGIIASIVLGWIVTKPLRIIQQDLLKIEVLELDDVVEHHSIFTELKSIYASLIETVTDLKEIKTFIPESVLNQLGQSKDLPKEMTALHNESPLHDNDSGHSQASVSKHSSLPITKMVGNILKLGLQEVEISVLYVQVRGLTEQEFVNPSELGNAASRIITSISNICRSLKLDLQIRTYDEFVIPFNSVTAQSVETAMKISSILSKDISEAEEAIKFHIGVASGFVLQGNIGSKNHRYHALIGSLMEKAQYLSKLNAFFNTTIIIDQTTFNHAKDQFFVRPVERYLMSKDIETVYQVLKPNQKCEDDEWMYVLAQNKQNDTYRKYSANFARLFLHENESQVEIAVDYFKDYINSHFHHKQKDHILERLENILKQREEVVNFNFSKYHSNIRDELCGYFNSTKLRTEHY
ncbi:hypothetical protein C9374_010487 [Naegleria lovaniensis]|uniref:Guanylate cyclase domain-containing protein n=1 Tax=Naegleria lovaniensis TaxID=51637 RepID=A0AA88GH24_NAELO|nr:uncharacterized protein C9374_010487 [Naegleria lovaniensis]KAG2374743.1 hypothetical protein C9374_010487 [Naegleria lovaniensis]